MSATVIGAAGLASSARGQEDFQATGTSWPAQHKALPPMAVGLIIQPANGAEAAIARVHDLGMSNCFLSLDGYLGKMTKPLAQEIGGLLEKYELVATAAEVVRPEPLVWDFEHGPSTIGLVPARHAHRPHGRAQANLRLRRDARDFLRPDPLRFHS